MIRFAALLFAAAALPHAFGQIRQPDSAAIAEVAAGKRTEAKAAWWGFDPADSTKSLQDAIRSGARRVVVEKMSSPWIVDKIQLASDQEIVFEPGVVVQAKRGAFHGKNDSLFSAIGCSNLILTGTGATLKMWKEDYTGPDYSKAEWRNTIALRSCTNVRISGFTLADSGGDGIYLGASRRGDANRKIEIRDVVMRNHHRQGISVISAEDLLIERCTFIDTAGTAPQSGIDFEPNNPEDRLVRCVLRDCRSENNRGIGFLFYLGQLRRESEPVSIRLERCVANGSQQSVNFATGNAEDAAVRGTVEFVDCRFEDAERQAIEIRRKPATGCKVAFTRCAVVNPAAKDVTLAPIAFSSSPGNTEDIGGAVFTDCSVTDSVDRRPLSFVDPTGELRLVDVSGTLHLETKSGTQDLAITPALLTEWFPRPPLRRFTKIKVDLGALKRVSPSDTAQNWAIAARVRQAADWLVYAEAGADVSLALRIHGVGKNASVPLVPVKVSTSGGRDVPVKLEKGDPSKRLIRFRAGEAGVYRVSALPGSATAELVESSAPACLFSESGALHLLGTTGEFRFWVPAGVKSFAVKVSGGGGTERIRASLVDPAGKVREEKDDIEAGTQLLVDLPSPSPGGAWTLKLSRPSHGVLEDFTVQLQGIPTLLGADAAALLKP